MKIISHRGNINGPTEDENKPHHVANTLRTYDVEIDVWYVNKKFYLGHDRPLYLVDTKFLLNPNLWCHAKNLDALYKMLELKEINCFWHENDRFTVTSKGYIWTFPSEPITTDRSVLVTNKPVQFELPIFGVCTDYPLKFR